MTSHVVYTCDRCDAESKGHPYPDGWFKIEATMNMIRKPLRWPDPGILGKVRDLCHPCGELALRSWNELSAGRAHP